MSAPHPMAPTSDNAGEAFVRAVQTAAYHLSCITADPAPVTLRFGLGGPVLRVTIEPNVAGDPIWDQTWVAVDGVDEGKGTWTGNRCGARDAVAAIYAAELLQLARS